MKTCSNSSVYCNIIELIFVICQTPPQFEMIEYISVEYEAVEYQEIDYENKDYITIDYEEFTRYVC